MVQDGARWCKMVQDGANMEIWDFQTMGEVWGGMCGQFPAAHGAHGICEKTMPSEDTPPV